VYTILGATGNIGSFINEKLLGKGEQVRVVGRSASRLRPFVQRGAEAFVADVNHADALTKALAGRAAFLMIPPNLASPDYRDEHEADSTAIVSAAKNAGLACAVNLSSIGAQIPAGIEPIAGLQQFEKKLDGLERLNILHLRPAFFMENYLGAIEMIRVMGTLARP
jgi:uncharacterized protein YbjT (DUF2867 family)